MKKLILIFISFISVESIFSKPIDISVCQDIEEGHILRYMANYKFYHKFNAGNKDVYINNYIIYFKHPEYLDKGSNFEWTKEIKKSSYRIPAHTSLKILDSGKINWKIVKHPYKRTNATRDSYDFAIIYKIIYDYSNTPNKKDDDLNRNACIFYSVSWCGDGIIDKEYEECDPGIEKYKNNCNPKTCKFY